MRATIRTFGSGKRAQNSSWYVSPGESRDTSVETEVPELEPGPVAVSLRLLCPERDTPETARDSAWFPLAFQPRPPSSKPPFTIRSGPRASSSTGRPVAIEPARPVEDVPERPAFCVAGPGAGGGRGAGRRGEGAASTRVNGRSEMSSTYAVPSSRR